MGTAGQPFWRWEATSRREANFKSATADETNTTALAADRAKMVAGLLINRYQVDPKKISISSSAGEGATVQLVLARND